MTEKNEDIGHEPVPRHIPISEAAAALRVKPRTVRRWAAEGRAGCPPAVKLGKNHYFRLDEWAAWLDERRAAAGDGGA